MGVAESDAVDTCEAGGPSSFRHPEYREKRSNSAHTYIAVSSLSGDCCYSATHPEQDSARASLPPCDSSCPCQSSYPHGTGAGSREGSQGRSSGGQPETSNGSNSRSGWPGCQASQTRARRSIRGLRLQRPPCESGHGPDSRELAGFHRECSHRPCPGVSTQEDGCPHCNPRPLTNTSPSRPV